MRIRGERDDAEDDLPWPLLDRYMTDRCSAEDWLELEDRLAVHPGWRAALESVRQFVRAPLPEPTVGSDALWVAMERRMAAAPRRRWRRRWVAEVGAIAAGLVVAAVLLGRSRAAPPVGGATDSVSSIVASVVPPETVATATADTERPSERRASGEKGPARVATVGRIRMAPAADERPPVDEGGVSLADERPGAADTRWP